MEQSLNITKKIEDSKTILYIDGTINTSTVSILNDALVSLDYTNLDLTLDFSNTSYITSAGLRCLLVARKKLDDKSIRLINVNDSIYEVLLTTGFDSFIKIYKQGSTSKEYNLSFSSLLEKRIDENKSKVAFVYKDNKYTWEDVDIASNIIASDLEKLGVNKRSHVGICSTNSINYIYTFFAIQKLGGIAVLINPGLTSAEVEKLCQVGEVSVLCYAEIPSLTTFSNYKESILKGNYVKNVYDISDYINFDNRFSENTSIEGKYNDYHDQDDPCLIIFTSGSTGTPKAVLSSAYSDIACILPVDDSIKFTEQDINLAFLPFFHIFGFETTISLGLLKGYCSIIPSSKKPEELIELIDKYKCTIFNTVPTMMLKIVNSKDYSMDKLSSLRASYLGGAATTKDQILLFKKLIPNTNLGVLYGMSENACISLTSSTDSTDRLTNGVGKPVSGMEIMIKDNKGKSLPSNHVGEICIRSNSLLVCYYKLDVSKQPIDENGWLATGDLGYIDNDGYLSITGRIKDLIISGGENISPNEIEQVLTEINSINEVKVIGIEDNVKGEIVVACLTLKPDSAFNEEYTRKYLSSRLAKYKLPVHYVLLNHFPVLGSGKIDSVSLKTKAIEYIKNAL